jgi:hypothetical protein
MRDPVGRFIALCPETGPDNVTFLAKRISDAVEVQTGLRVRYGISSFPDEALNFEDLLLVARDRARAMPATLPAPSMQPVPEVDEKVAK